MSTTARHAAPAERGRVAAFYRKHTKATIVGILIAALTATGIATAAWLFNNVAGDAGAKTGTIAAPTIVALTGPEITDTLLPGDSGPLTLKVNNPNSVDLVMTAVDRDGSISSSNEGGCPASNLSTPGLDVSGLSISIPAGETVVTVPGNIVHLDNAAPSDCNGGVRFTIPVLADFATP